MQIKRLSLEIFGGCNFSCKMCPQGKDNNGRQQDFLKLLPFKLFEKILDDASQYGVQVVNIEGSGEATLNKHIVKYIEAVKKRDMLPLLYTNGLLVKGKLMHDMFNAGLYICRFSDIGYDAETYKNWMQIDAFNTIIKHANEALNYVQQQNIDAVISSYHLIIDNNRTEWEIEQYKKNFIEPAGTEAEIWKMHNWAGQIDSNTRQGTVSSCGRPFSPDLTIRAGGLNGKNGAVVPCCQTMGAPKESKSVLGHLQDNTIEEIFNGEEYNNLREAHTTGNYEQVPYCLDCDFLIHDPNVLVYTNNPERVKIGNMKATDISLRDLRF